MQKSRYIQLIVLVFFLALPFGIKADTLLEERMFTVDSVYDVQKRQQVSAVLQKISSKLYFYLEKDWWDALSISDRKIVNTAMDELAQEFENNIYPVLTSNYGSEWTPGIDNDPRITILIHPMSDSARGYVSTADEYSKYQAPSSNEREMIYLSSNGISDIGAKSFLAHEFTHLITFNQKDRLRGVTEEVWLNELRAEYAPTLVGYDQNYDGSNLQRRIRNFLDNPRDSLTEWQGKSADYGALNLFVQYFVDYYGVKVLKDSLKSDKIGIASLNQSLLQNGYSENFSQIFTDWTIAIFVNNCKAGLKYCYLNENLRDFRISPAIYYLPSAEESSLSVGYSTKEWAGNWQKIIGTNRPLKLDFSGGSNVNFEVPYVVEDSSGNISVKFITLDQSQKGTVKTSDGKTVSLTIIPSIQNKLASFTDKENSYQFFWTIKTDTGILTEAERIQELQQKIQELLAQIAQLQAQLAGGSVSCASISVNLSFGMANSQEVRCLQQFLKNQGSDIYPEGLVTGRFGVLTRLAVIRFQEKYSGEVLSPIGLIKGTGFVGVLTRAKINKLLKP